MTEKYILVIEKDKILNSIICKICQKSGYKTKSSSEYIDCEDDLLKKSGSFCLIIMNFTVKDKFGEIALKAARKIIDIPILCISSEKSFSIRAIALNLGADDFVNVPFDVAEFIARVNCILRRYISSSVDDCIKFKDILLDLKRHVVLVNNSHIDLTIKEFEILKLLLQNPKDVFSKEEIYSSVWDDEYFNGEKILNTHICNLRRKLNLCGDKEKYIHTVWGIGYRLSID